MIQLCCFDLAGTTVRDDGAVAAAFDAAFRAVGLGPDAPDRPEFDAYVAATMGTSKIEVFRRLIGPERAPEANAAFEAEYAAGIAAGGAAAIPGAEEALQQVKAAGIKVAFHTGFSATTRDALIAALGWGDLADLVLCPAEAGRGRPAPDMILTSVLRLRVDAVSDVAAVGDTVADMRAGRRAGCGVVAGVLTGTGSESELSASGATVVLPSVRDVPGLLGLD